jgi:two-component system, NarL family, response regulator LiaR
VDDDAYARRAVRDALERAGIAVVAEGASGVDAIDLAREHRPDVVLMDICMPGMDGVAATRRIVQEQPDQVVILVSGSQDEDLGVMGIRLGATGFVDKDVDVEVLPRIVLGAIHGEAVISRTLTRRLIDQIRLAPIAGDGFRPVHSPLTRREWEVLDLICQGKSTEEIAGAFVVSIETIRSHIKRILQKLGVNSRTEAVAVVRRIRGAGVEPAMASWQPDAAAQPRRR